MGDAIKKAVVVTLTVVVILAIAIAGGFAVADSLGGDDSNEPTVSVGETGGDTGINTSESCLTTGEAKAALGLDVQRLGLEACGWVFRSVGVGSAQATCPDGWVCTLHLADDSINVYVGDGESYTIVAGTFRMIDAYPSNDAVHEDPPCELLRKEKNFGQVEDPSFPVDGGNFTCGDDDNSRSSGSSGSSDTQAQGVSCPANTVPIEDGQACKYGPTGRNDPVTVPAGWTAEFWDGTAVQNVAGPTTIMTGEATLRPAA